MFTLNELQIAKSCEEIKNDFGPDFTQSPEAMFQLGRLIASIAEAKEPQQSIFERIKSKFYTVESTKKIKALTSVIKKLDIGSLPGPSSAKVLQKVFSHLDKAKISNSKIIVLKVIAVALKFLEPEPSVSKVILNKSLELNEAGVKIDSNVQQGLKKMVEPLPNDHVKVDLLLRCSKIIADSGPVISKTLSNISSSDVARQIVEKSLIHIPKLMEIPNSSLALSKLEAMSKTVHGLSEQLYAKIIEEYNPTWWGSSTKAKEIEKYVKSHKLTHQNVDTTTLNNSAKELLVENFIAINKSISNDDFTKAITLFNDKNTISNLAHSMWKKDISAFNLDTIEIFLNQIKPTKVSLSHLNPFNDDKEKKLSLGDLKNQIKYLNPLKNSLEGSKLEQAFIKKLNLIVDPKKTLAENREIFLKLQPYLSKTLVETYLKIYPKVDSEIFKTVLNSNLSLPEKIEVLAKFNGIGPTEADQVLVSDMLQPADKSNFLLKVNLSPEYLDNLVSTKIDSLIKDNKITSEESLKIWDKYIQNHKFNIKPEMFNKFLKISGDEKIKTTILLKFHNLNDSQLQSILKSELPVEQLSKFLLETKSTVSSIYFEEFMSKALKVFGNNSEHKMDFFKIWECHSKGKEIPLKTFEKLLNFDTTIEKTGSQNASNTLKAEQEKVKIIKDILKLKQHVASPEARDFYKKALEKDLSYSEDKLNNYKLDIAKLYVKSACFSPDKEFIEKIASLKVRDDKISEKSAVLEKIIEKSPNINFDNNLTKKLKAGLTLSSSDNEDDQVYIKKLQKSLDLHKAPENKTTPVHTTSPINEYSKNHHEKQVDNSDNSPDKTWEEVIKKTFFPSDFHF